MLLILVYSFTINVLLTTADNVKSTHMEIRNTRLGNSHSALGKTRPIHNTNITYIDKSDNVLRVPDMNKNYEEHKAKRKNLKKPPKRTVQKIIKKIRSRRKLYLNQATSMPTKAPMSPSELEQFYAQEEMLQKKENNITVQVNQKKKKRWPSSRYPMPFQHMTSKKDPYKRHKRSEDREDVFIFKDLDEVKFLEEGKNENVVRAHIKKYW